MRSSKYDRVLIPGSFGPDLKEVSDGKSADKRQKDKQVLMIVFFIKKPPL